MTKFSAEFDLLNGLLTEKLAAANFSVPELMQEQLLHYLFLLNKWNHVYNLTGISEPQGMITQHILDSLSITPYLHGKQILDVGTGAGLPGIPLAITQPERNFVLIDSNGKKTRFLNHVIQSLALTNVKVVQARVEQFAYEHCFDSIISRAFSSIIDFLQKTQHLCCMNGQFLAMKGTYPTGELVALNDAFKVLAVHKLVVPGLVAERHLVVVESISSPMWEG